LRNNVRPRPSGFSLIEIIITLVVLAIAGTMLATFMGPGITRSTDPLRALQNDAELQAVMENMIADAQTQTLDVLQGRITAKNYGSYTIERNTKCKLNTATNTFEDDAATGTFLCVTISHPSQSGSKISYLFTATAASP